MAKSGLLGVVDDLQDSYEAGEGSVTIGIDLGDRYSNCCVLSEEATVLAQGRIRNSAETLQRYFRDIPRCRIAIEAGTHSRWIYELLSSWGHEVIVHGTRPLGSVAGEDETRKAFSTQATYAGYLRKWILPRWRSYRLADVKAVQVEQWLKSLPVSRGTKAKIRNIMSALYSHAQRWEWVTSNPITHVRQSAKRSRVPTVLTPHQLKEFLANLADPAKTAVLLGALTGLRVGELLGLKWSDIDFEKLEICVVRDVVKQRIERCKTEASKKAIPIDAELAETLWSWRLRCPYNQPEDWVFGSPQRKGKQPYWPSSLFRVALQPALKAAGITEPVGWHTLRHTFGTLMKANGEDVKTIQELLRHANFKVTMDVYTQAVTDVKRTAHSRVARQIMGPIREGEKDDG